MAAASGCTPTLLPTTLLIFCFMVLFSSSLPHPPHSVGYGDRNRELLEVPSRGDRDGGLVWIVQLSDLHFSSHHPNRSISFKKIIPPILSLIRPELVIITGDLTDGKSKDRMSMQQDELEWIQYRDTMDWVITKSGLPENVFFDVRGNHDKFGVPKVGSQVDYFSKYSISARLNRTATVQSITLKTGEWKHLFVGIDYSMEIGLRGPCNLFGHAKDEHHEALNKDLSQWDDSHPGKITKLVYGHFTTTFIASSENGSRPEDVFAKHNISAYLCGHLHCQFGKNLLKHHFRSLSKDVGEFWEWEMGDWKENRVLRIIAIDHGYTSFLDLSLADMDADNRVSATDSFVLVTHPLDSRKMQRRTFSFMSANVHNSVRALVFSNESVILAKALVYDSDRDLFTPLIEFELQESFKAGDNVIYLVSPLNMTSYMDPSPTRFLLQVVAITMSGRQIASDLRPFSGSGQLKSLGWTLKEFFVMGIVWDDLYKPLLWTAFGVLLSFLLIQKLHFYQMRNGYHSQSPSKSNSFSMLRKVLLQTYEATTKIWWAEFFIIIYLMFMPWFWGKVLGDDYRAGSMSVKGWSINNITEHHGKFKKDLGVPDVIVIVLSYLYMILVPTFLIVSALFIEQSLVRVYSLFYVKKYSAEQKCKVKKSEQDLDKIVSKRWLRKVLLVACLGVIYLHAQQTRAVVGAYGWTAMLISPGFAWPVPLLLVTAILLTSYVQPHLSKPVDRF